MRVIANGAAYGTAGRIRGGRILHHACGFFGLLRGLLKRGGPNGYRLASMIAAQLEPVGDRSSPPL
jgi:hypothetical protein